MKTIEVVVFDRNGYEEMRSDFDTIKQAQEMIKEAYLNPGYWDRRAEQSGYAENIQTVQLLVNGEVHSDWFPNFKAGHI